MNVNDALRSIIPQPEVSELVYIRRDIETKKVLGALYRLQEDMKDSFNLSFWTILDREMLSVRNLELIPSTVIYLLEEILPVAEIELSYPVQIGPFVQTRTHLICKEVIGRPEFISDIADAIPMLDQFLSRLEELSGKRRTLRNSKEWVQ